MLNQGTLRDITYTVNQHVSDKMRQHCSPSNNDHQSLPSTQRQTIILITDKARHSFTITIVTIQLQTKTSTYQKWIRQHSVDPMHKTQAILESWNTKKMQHKPRSSWPLHCYKPVRIKPKYTSIPSLTGQVAGSVNSQCLWLGSMPAVLVSGPVIMQNWPFIPYQWPWQSLGLLVPVKTRSGWVSLDG